MFFAILSVACVVGAGPGGLVDLVSEVIVCFSIGSVVQAGPDVLEPVIEATELEFRESTLTSLWLSWPGPMGYTVSGLTTGTTGDVGSGLVPGLKGYGVSSRLPVSE